MPIDLKRLAERKAELERELVRLERQLDQVTGRLHEVALVTEWMENPENNYVESVVGRLEDAINKQFIPDL